MTMAEPAQPTQPGSDDGKRSRTAEFHRGRGRPKVHTHRVSLESLKGGLPGVHKIPGRK